MRDCDQMKLFCTWTRGEMNGNRLASLESIRRNAGLEVVLITNGNLDQWVPHLHPAFAFLSGNHRGDYLRAYLMHHYGGGHSDIKPCHFDWRPYAAVLQANPHWAIGYTEVPRGTPVPDLEPVHRQLIGNGHYIFKPGTPLTREWWQNVCAKMDEKAEALAQFPAIAPREQPEGYPYPMAWAELGGCMFHPVNYKYAIHVLHGFPMVDMTNYR